MISRRFKYTHWLKIESENNIEQWKKLKEYNDNNDCAMTIYYYDHNPLKEKVLKLDCNQSLEELDLNIKNSFNRIKARPTNSTPLNRNIYSFFEEYLGIKAEDIKKNKSYEGKEILPVNTLEEFADLENVEILDELLKDNNWRLVKIKSDRGFKYQLYFGKGVQVDNRYEYAYFDFQFKSRIKDRLQRLINYEIKNSKVNLSRFIGHQLNFFGAKYEFITGEKVFIEPTIIGVVVGIDKGNVYMFDIRKPHREQFYTISLEDFEKSVRKGYYKVNNNLLTNYEKLEIRKYLKNKLNEFAELCGDWDFRNIDMTDSHLQSISIKNNIITTSCEKFSTELDDYVSCNSGEIENKGLVNDFNLLDLSNREKVLDYISTLESHIDFEHVDNLLNNEEQNKLKELEQDLEEEMEI